jgi:hypothetical protein
MKTIIEMAREANVYCTTRQPTLDAMLERFAALVRADEREACAKVVDHILKEGGGTWGDAIRARGNT